MQRGCAAIHIAAYNNSFEALKLLLNEPAYKVDTVSDRGETALHLASFCGHRSIVQYLVSRRAQVYLKDNDDNMALHYAVVSDDCKLLQWLLVQGNCAEYINHVNKVRLSCLGFSVNLAYCWAS